jgi:transcriptional regulator with XRE-family HTH domain
MVHSSASFGQRLRRMRLEAELGLRELARRIGRSPGYLSDVELDNVPPPSGAVIVRIAQALQIDPTLLLAAARKVDPDLADYMARQPEAADFLRLARDHQFDGEDWQRLIQLARISRLGTQKDGDR